MTCSVRVCSSASLATLVDLFSWADELRLAYAWATSRDGQAPHWKALPLDKVTRATIGIQFAQTEPAVLRALLDVDDAVLKVVDDTGGVFHPKVVVGIQGANIRALVGSSNFTTGGFSGNTELNILLSGPATDPAIREVVEFVDQQWKHPRAFVPNEDWLTRYERAYESRPRPKPVPKPAGPRDKVLIRTAEDLDIEWPDYFALIQQQERRSLSNGYTIHVFDHQDGSYLQEIEACQAAFRQFPKFEKMPLEQRKFVAGFGGTSGYFGRMVGAGNFKSMIIRRPEEVGRLLDAIPTSGIPTDPQVLAYLRGVKGLSSPNGRSFMGFGTATRLLIAKRPDVFLSLNSASQDRIRDVFGAAPRDDDKYLQLLRRIWSTPWFRSPEPDDEHQRRIWRVRVAVLDAIMYDPE